MRVPAALARTLAGVPPRSTGRFVKTLTARSQAAERTAREFGTQT
jgi:hypothetical protein